MAEYIIKDTVEDRKRTIYFDIPYSQFKDEILSSDAYVNFTKFGSHHISVLLAQDEFLQSVDIISSTYPDDKDMTIEDYFNNSNTEQKKSATAVILYPYIKHEDLAKETGRDYIREMDKCAAYIRDISEDF